MPTRRKNFSKAVRNSSTFNTSFNKKFNDSSFFLLFDKSYITLQKYLLFDNKILSSVESSNEILWRDPIPSFKLINYKDAFSVHISLQSCSTRSSISRPCYDTEEELYLKEKEKEPVWIRPISHPTRSNFPSRRVT